jgi:hypothetical protein
VFSGKSTRCSIAHTLEPSYACLSQPHTWRAVGLVEEEALATTVEAGRRKAEALEARRPRPTTTSLLTIPDTTVNEI